MQRVKAALEASEAQTAPPAAVAVFPKMMLLDIVSVVPTPSATAPPDAARLPAATSPDADSAAHASALMPPPAPEAVLFVMFNDPKNAPVTPASATPPPRAAALFDTTEDTTCSTDLYKGETQFGR